MKKVAIVGPEGSGKTVMLAGLGALYERPDEAGYYLEPIDRNTYSYVNGLVDGMRNGQWPAATETDAQKRLTWNLRQTDAVGPRDVVCRISFLDFAGEIYRDAFGRGRGEKLKFKEESAALCRSVRQSDVVFVLVNLSDIISGRGGTARATEIGWATKSILDYIHAPNRVVRPRAVIVLTQADSYKAMIESEGGAKNVLVRYLPVVGNLYSNIDVIAVTSVDKVTLDENGFAVPDGDFTFAGLKVVMDEVLSEIKASGEETGLPKRAKTRQESSGFMPTVTGAAIIVALLLCSSWKYGSVARGGFFMFLMLLFWGLTGVHVLWDGLKRMKENSFAAMIATLVLIVGLGCVMAQFVDLLRGVEALGSLVFHSVFFFFGSILKLS